MQVTVEPPHLVLEYEDKYVKYNTDLLEAIIDKYLYADLQWEVLYPDETHVLHSYTAHDHINMLVAENETKEILYICELYERKYTPITEPINP